MAGVVSLWKAYEKDTLDKVQGKNNGNIKELVADSTIERSAKGHLKTIQSSAVLFCLKMLWK